MALQPLTNQGYHATHNDIRSIQFYRKVETGIVGFRYPTFDPRDNTIPVLPQDISSVPTIAKFTGNDADLPRILSDMALPFRNQPRAFDWSLAKITFLLAHVSYKDRCAVAEIIGIDETRLSYELKNYAQLKGLLYMKFGDMEHYLAKGPKECVSCNRNLEDDDEYHAHKVMFPGHEAEVKIAQFD